jgi:cyclohexadienyl dehydratase
VSRLRLLAALVVAAACARQPPPPTGPPLRVGTSGDYPPFSIAQDGPPQGFDVDVARRYARDRGRPLELVPFRWADLTEDLRSGRFDVAMSGVTMRPERAAVGWYTRPVVETGAVVVTRPEIATSVDEVDRRGIRLGVNRGGYLETVARRLFPDTILEPVDDNTALGELLATGGADAVLSDGLEAGYILQQVGDAIVLGPLTHDRKAYLAADPGLAADLDAWLRDGDQVGWLAELRARWFGRTPFEPASAFDSDLSALVAFVDLRLAFMPGIAAAKAAANLPLVDPQQEGAVLAAAHDEAVARGLDPDAVDDFFKAQIEAAREAQKTCLALAPDRRGRIAVLDLAREARPAIARVSQTILARAADVAARRESLVIVPPKRIASRLDPTFVPIRERRGIAAAIVALRCAGPPCTPLAGLSYGDARCVSPVPSPSPSRSSSPSSRPRRRVRPTSA